jgi:hypothetical protein
MLGASFGEDGGLDLGLAYFKSGAVKEANETFTLLLKSIPANTPEHTRVAALIGLSRYSMGENSSAIPYLIRSGPAGGGRSARLQLGEALIHIATVVNHADIRVEAV